LNKKAGDFKDHIQETVCHVVAEQSRGSATASPKDDSRIEYFSQVFENIEIREETHKDLLSMP
jgi:hypothetical protein